MSDVAYVQVKFDPASQRHYTYQDATGTLQIGDQVMLDPDKGDTRIVTVVGQEPNTYQGEVKKITSQKI